MNQSESIKELAGALNKAQSEMSGAKKGSNNPFFKSKYADLVEVIQCAKEALYNNGLAISQFPITEDNKAGVKTILMHVSGEYLCDTLLLPCAKQDPQGAGSAITYARRYAYQSILGIPSEDDDGNMATRHTHNHQAPAKATKPNSQIADSIKALQAVKDGEQLKTVWLSLPATMHNNEAVKKAKDEMKAKLGL